MVALLVSVGPTYTQGHIPQEMRLPRAPGCPSPLTTVASPMLLILSCSRAFVAASLHDKPKPAPGAASELTRLGAKYGTDKVRHRFTDLYHRLFGPQRHDVRRFLEIGVFKGQSIRMWNDYFERADIFGMDYFRAQNRVLKRDLRLSLQKDLRRGNNGTFFEQVAHGALGTRVKLIDANQSDVGEMEATVRKLRAGGRFDIIIEDGSHMQRDQQLNLGQLFPLVRPGGIYVIEDISTGYHWGYDEPPGSNGTTVRVMKFFNATRTMRSRHLSTAQTRYLERWIESSEIVTTGRKRWDVTCVIHKRLLVHPTSMRTDSRDRE